MPKGKGRPGKPGPKSIQARIKKAQASAKQGVNPLLVRTQAKMKMLKKKK